MPAHQPPTAVSLVVRESKGQPFYEAKFRGGDRQVKRRIGPAWLTRDADSGEWTPRRGPVPADRFDERRAYARAAGIVSAHEAQTAEERERRAQGATFREVAHAYLDWLEHVKGAAPSTLRQPGRTGSPL